MAGFYIDALAWPNEAGAIPTTNVTREEAKRLCEEKGKRLCSELEWERACKGPDNDRYEYGAVYDARPCGAGVPADVASRRPSGQRPACRSPFGVADMHAGASEWTASRWGRGGHDRLGVVRGGNDSAGERVTRFAYGRPMPPGERSAVTGFRCCAGPRNEAEVRPFDVKLGPAFERRRTRHACARRLSTRSAASRAGRRPRRSRARWLAHGRGAPRRTSSSRCRVAASAETRTHRCRRGRCARSGGRAPDARAGRHRAIDPRGVLVAGRSVRCVAGVTLTDWSFSRVGVRLRSRGRQERSLKFARAGGRCAGPVPQHPPTRVAPFCTQPRAHWA